MSDLTHIDESGHARMVDVGDKPVTRRTATAEGFIEAAPETLGLINAQALKKGDVLGVAQLAGIMGAKRASELIPLCHPLPLTSVEVALTVEEERIRITATCRTDGRTGVEMEALTAVTVAGLTVYDMCKAVDKGMRIGGIRLLYKEGGRSGTFTAQP